MDTATACVDDLAPVRVAVRSEGRKLAPVNGSASKASGAVPRGIVEPPGAAGWLATFGNARPTAFAAVVATTFAAHPTAAFAADAAASVATDSATDSAAAAAARLATAAACAVAPRPRCALAFGDARACARA